MRRMRVAALLAGAAFAGGCTGPGAGGADPDALHRDAVVVDTHSDTTGWLLDPAWDFGARHETGHVDLPRLREGGVDGMFWSIYVGRRDAPGDAVREALVQIDAVHELVRRRPDELVLATSADDVRRAAASGRVACLMGAEGGHLIADDLALLRTYQRLGVRYLTLTHAFHTGWADSSGTNERLEPAHHGLTAFGEEVVREMNRLGMLVDLSHVSDATFFHALRVSRAPVIASHSSARAVADHPRNLSDPMLRALAAGGGVAMINFYSGYVDPESVGPLRDLFRELAPELARIRERLSADPVAARRAYRDLFAGHPRPRAPLAVLLDHFDHALAVAGPEHVGIGADWDGVVSMPEGLEDVSRLPALTRGLLARGHPPEVVRQVLGGNVLRVMDAAARAADRPVPGV